MDEVRTNEEVTRHLADAVELGVLLDQAMEAFGRQHEELIRRACSVPVEVTDLGHVVTCTFLGHSLSHIRIRQGAQSAERLALTILENLALVESALSQKREALQ